MAIQLNSFSKTGISNSLLNSSGIFSFNSDLYLYPSTVAFPSSVSSPPSGWIANYTSLTFIRTGNTISINTGTTTKAASASGTLSWWWFGNDSTYAMISDSITLSGGGGIIVVNTLTPSSGQNVSITFNLTIGS